jgi:hypothetical protein
MRLQDCHFDRLDIRLLREIGDLAERASIARLTGGPAPVQPCTAEPALGRLAVVIEDGLASLNRTTTQLVANAELLDSAMRAVTEREALEATTPRTQRVSEELKTVIEELTAAIERLRKAERMPLPIGTEAEEPTGSDPQTMPDPRDLGHEVRELLKELG